MKHKINFIIFLLIAVIPAHAARIDTLMVFSKSMNKYIPNLVITPANYNAGKTRFPVLFLLHGAGDNYLGWMQIAPELPKYADQNKIIIVCPDGGETSWYFDSPIDKTVRYETYITSELITAFDAKYKSRPSKNARAIAGLSMGGHGAFLLAFRHQHIYGAAGSISGALDIRPFQTNWDLPKRLGSYAEHPDNWEKNTVINQVSLLVGKSLSIIFDCGVNDFFYAVNKRLHEEMLLRKIPHDYSERPGEHNAPYWHNSIKYQMVFFNEFFNKTR